jgi:hypothetical protein
MSASEAKTRMISLRVSDAEYVIMKSQYRTHGARNVSDLARLALQQMMNGSKPPIDLAVKLAALENRLSVLESEVSALREQDLAET